MKIIHLSDLHLGKRVNEFSLLEDQRYLLGQILKIIEEESPQAVLIAGDVYDKTVPQAEAVTLFDSFISKLSALRTNVIIISGNHDSPERLSFGAAVMAKGGIHIAPVCCGKLSALTLEDEFGPVRFHMYPFVKPAQARAFFPDEEISDARQAAERILKDACADDGGRDVCVAHLFVAGSSRCDSEDAVAGGLDAVDAELFHRFDYTALGHLHGPQQFCGGRVRYCGSPLKYSFSEAAHKKSLTVAELREKGSLSIRTVPLVPLRDMREIRGTYDELTDRSFYDGLNREDYFHITLTDENDIFEAAAKLRVIYPRLMRLDYDNRRTRAGTDGPSARGVENKTPLALFGELYEKQNGAAMTAEQAEYLSAMIDKVWGDAQ